MAWKDTVPNLQLLEGRKNESKNATPFKAWFEGKYKDKKEQERFANDNYLPNDVSLELKNFKSFYENRKKTLAAKLRDILALTTDTVSDEQSDWNDRDDEIEATETKVS